MWSLLLQTLFLPLELEAKSDRSQQMVMTGHVWAGHDSAWQSVDGEGRDGQLLKIEILRFLDRDADELDRAALELAG